MDGWNSDERNEARTIAKHGYVIEFESYRDIESRFESEPKRTTCSRPDDLVTRARTTSHAEKYENSEGCEWLKRV